MLKLQQQQQQQQSVPVLYFLLLLLLWYYNNFIIIHHYNCYASFVPLTTTTTMTTLLKPSFLPTTTRLLLGLVMDDDTTKTTTTTKAKKTFEKESNIDNHNDNYSTTTTTKSPYQSLQQYILSRNVTIRSVNWCHTLKENTFKEDNSKMKYRMRNNNNNNTDATTLLQIYYGRSVPPATILFGNNIINVTSIFNYIQRMMMMVIIKEKKLIPTDDVLLLPSFESSSLWYSEDDDDDMPNIIASMIQNRVQEYMKEATIISSLYQILSLSMKLYAEIRVTYNTIQLIQKQHIHILYMDDHICVLNKPSGILSVPGPRRNPNICEALYYILNPPSPQHQLPTNSYNDDKEGEGDEEEQRNKNNNIIKMIDQMVVHRLDMDTSGILVFALSKVALKKLHTDFRSRYVTKVYEALVCGHINGTTNEYEINVDLERDPHHVPFMRIAQPPKEVYNSSVTSSSLVNNSSESSSSLVNNSSESSSSLVNNSSESSSLVNKTSKFLGEESKPSLTEMHILSYEYIEQNDILPTTTTTTTTTTSTTTTTDTKKKKMIPVTRVQLIPRTGRTHQLRVHTAQVLDHPIVGDDIYGYGGVCFLPYNNNNNTHHHHQYHNETDNDNLSLSLHMQQQRELAELGLPLCLHARKLCIRHPISGAPMIFECQPHF